jgi:hypothetical protein
LHIVTLPFPRAVMMNGERLPASYANFYIANDVVVMPTFNDPNDRVALDILANLMPSRTVVGIHAVDLVWGLGTLHCLTQQEPAGQLNPAVRWGDGTRVRRSSAMVQSHRQTLGPTFGPRPQTPRTGPSHLRTFAPSDRTAAYLRTASDTLNAAPGIATPAIS